ncbi:DUF2059 domain-containing protein [Maritalea sp.]|jgi:hypothetical protein|uniref:DUF2059 domain-containing protein n=1 Tax=Maritalea sp. TaxID=2003361 RepID=UPI0039E51C0C
MAILKYISTWTIAASAAVLLSFGAQAQEIGPEHLALAKKYVAMTDTGYLYERVIVDTSKTAMQFLVQQNPEIAASIATAAKDVAISYFDGDNELHDSFARIYAVRFSVEELSEIVAFYETPVGQKVLANNQAIGKNIESAASIWKSNLETEIAIKLRTLLKERGFDF